MLSSFYSSLTRRFALKNPPEQYQPPPQHPFTKLLWRRAIQPVPKSLSVIPKSDIIDESTKLPLDIVEMLQSIYSFHPQAVHDFDLQEAADWILPENHNKARKQLESTIYNLSENPKPTTGIVFLNMGGPSRLNEVHPFLHRLFMDGDCVRFGGQNMFFKMFWKTFARLRTPKVVNHYADIGGGSPIRYWSEKQAHRLESKMDQISPDTAPHRVYTSFRYAQPMTSEAVDRLARDEVKRIVLFSQYPQWSCTTSGSSINEFWRQSRSNSVLKQAEFSIIDRWFNFTPFQGYVASKIRGKVERDGVNPLIVFSAHSLPVNVVQSGDPYALEVASTVHSIMSIVNSNPQYSPLSYQLTYQSSLNDKWLGPSTESLVKSQKYSQMLIVPISFTSDHIETLYEIDIELTNIVNNLKPPPSYFERTPSYNDDPTFVNYVQAPIVKQHLDSGVNASPQYQVKCTHCPFPQGHCRTIMNPVDPFDLSLVPTEAPGGFEKIDKFEDPIKGTTLLQLSSQSSKMQKTGQSNQ